MVYPTNVFLVKKSAIWQKTAHVKHIAAVNNQSNSVVNSLLPHEIQPEKVFNTSSDNVWKGKSVYMLCSNPPQFALPECSMDTLRQEIGMSVSAPSMEIIPVIPPHFALHECSMDTLQKHVGMLVFASSLEIVPIIDPVADFLIGTTHAYMVFKNDPKFRTK